MARISNVLTGDTAQPVDGTGAWQFSNASAFIHREDTPVNVESMVLLRPSSPAIPVVIRLNEFQIPPALRGDSVDFGFYIKSQAKIDIALIAKNDNTTQMSIATDSFIEQTKTFVPAKGAWAFCRANKISTGNTETAQFIDIEITINGHVGEAIYFARPVLTPTFFHLEDDATEVVMSYLPENWVELDLQSVNIVAGLGKLLHVLSIAYQDCYYLHRSIQNLDHVDSWNEGVTEFSSTLVSPNYVPKETARWLAQFVGTILIDPSAGLTPWANLPKVWANWANIDTPDPGSEVDWSEIEGFNVELIGISEYFSWQIETQSYSANGGTLGAMKKAAQRVLTGDKVVDVTHHPTLDWTIQVRTKQAETTPLLLLSAMYAAKPAGFDVIINTPSYLD